MQAFDEHETCAVRPHQDLGLSSMLSAILSSMLSGDLVHALLFEGGAPFDRYVDVGDWEVSRFIMIETEDSIKLKA